MTRLTATKLVEIVERSEVIPTDTLEVSLSKSEGHQLVGPRMATFQGGLAAWARRMAADGYEIRSEPEPGPGTMVWKAVKK
jgi:hypothetical protein